MILDVELSKDLRETQARLKQCEEQLAASAGGLAIVQAESISSAAQAGKSQKTLLATIDLHAVKLRLVGGRRAARTQQLAAAALLSAL